jgi:hypothetical protein
LKYYLQYYAGKLVVQLKKIKELPIRDQMYLYASLSQLMNSIFNWH